MNKNLKKVVFALVVVLLVGVTGFAITNGKFERLEGYMYSLADSNISTATPSDATPSNADLDVATPSDATPSDATSSDADSEEVMGTDIEEEKVSFLEKGNMYGIIIGASILAIVAVGAIIVIAKKKNKK